MSKGLSLTPRQRLWIEHLRQCAERGQSLSAYAAEHGLKLGSLYEAKSELRRRGIWPTPSPRFVRVQPVRAAEAAPLPTVYRVSLPNGVVVEAAGGEWSAVLSAAAQLPAACVRHWPKLAGCRRELRTALHRVRADAPTHRSHNYPSARHSLPHTRHGSR